MGQVTELRDALTHERDYRGQRVAFRRFRVEAPPDQIDWGYVGLGPATIPTQSSPHPNYPGALADRIVIDHEPGRNDRSIVTVQYSSNRQFRGPPPPAVQPTLPGFLSWAFDFQTIEALIPYYTRHDRTVTTGTPPNATPATTSVWEAQAGPRAFVETHTIASARVPLFEFNPAGVWLPINSQLNTIHLLTGGDPADPRTEQWLFESAYIRQGDETGWEAEYRWRLDPGTKTTAEWIAELQSLNQSAPTVPPNPPPTPDIRVVFPFDESAASPGQFVRPPHTYFEVTPPAEPTTKPPYAGLAGSGFAIIKRFPINPAGHLTLPGLEPG